MKKAAILSIAAFYLILTTGMYVCVLHCTAGYFVQPKIAMHASCAEAHAGKEHKPCKDKSGCDCCKKHGTYAIKENLKPAVDFQSQQFVAIINHPVIINIPHQYDTSNATLGQDSNAPPWKSGKAISIQFRSLQI